VTGVTPTKDHKSENFPVASRLIAARHRPLVMAFYTFARAGDDFADAPGLTRDARLAELEKLRVTLAGETEGAWQALALRRHLAALGLSARHGLDLLEAFRRDCTKTRYADWDELYDYCRHSAMPVGRFMLDVHGEDPTLYPASDALCAALQVINHLQDARKDYAAMDRVYLPADALASQGLDAFGLAAASPALAAAIRCVVPRVEALLAEAAPFAAAIADRGLALEVAAIHALAVDLTRRLARDPFGPRLHHGKLAALLVALPAIGALALRRIGIRLSL